MKPMDQLGENTNGGIFDLVGQGSGFILQGLANGGRVVAHKGLVDFDLITIGTNQEDDNRLIRASALSVSCPI